MQDHEKHASFSHPRDAVHWIQSESGLWKGIHEADIVGLHESLETFGEVRWQAVNGTMLCATIKGLVK